MRILLAGGGTGGPVVPLLAVYQKIKKDHPEVKFLLIGTNKGPERIFAQHNNLDFQSIPAGKWRRYFSFANFVAPFEVIAGFIKALKIIKEFNPDVVFGAGGYVAVPVMLAAFIKRKKIVIHQQDIRTSLTNKILSPLADKITVSFEWSLKDFYSGSGISSLKKEKVIWTGNPCREEFLKIYSDQQLKKIREGLGLTERIPVIFVFGGGTGAQGLNLILEEALPDLVRFAYAIHGTGSAKKSINFQHPRYLPQTLISNMADVCAIADFVVCRAGLSTITELSVSKKAAIIVPMPDSHQVDNALVLKYFNAAIVLNQNNLDGAGLTAVIRKLMYDLELQTTLRQNICMLMPRDATEKVAKIILQLCQ